MAYKFSFRPKKESKYRNRKIIDFDGNKFDSKKEYERWITLNLLQKAGQISGLKRQVEYRLLPSYKGIQQGVKYVADFVYAENFKCIVEDVKSDITRKKSDYIIKKKLLYHIYKIKIKEV